jgi:2-hydroxychromene-2-carboxylate isomerase
VRAAREAPPTHGLEFFFDYGSPFSYLADTQLAALAARTGCSVTYRPMLLGAVLKATGNASPIAVPAKGLYMGTELRRWAVRYAVPVPHNPFFPINTLRVMRGAVAAELAGNFAAYHRAVFRAFWADGENLGDDAVLRRVLEHAAVDGAALIGRLDQPEVKERLRATTDEAVRRGVFGAPTFFVGDEMFWGNDRLDFVEAALGAAR